MCTWWASGFGQVFLAGSHYFLNFSFNSTLSFFSISLSSDAKPVRDSWEVVTGSPECVHMCVKPHPVSGWWVMTPHSPALLTPRVRTWGPLHPDGYLPGSVSHWLNRTSTVFHCGAFPHASKYDSLSNQREGDASLSDLIEPGAHAQPSRCSHLLKKQNEWGYF